jgi:hypothetical protein
MLTAKVQRWRNGDTRWRHAGEVFDPRRYEVEIIHDDTTAKTFIEREHYSRSYPAARVRVGLYDRGAPVLGRDPLVGVAVFSMPMNDKVLDRLPCGREEGVELGRFVLLDDVAANAETWMLTRAFELLGRAGYKGVVSFADPLPRPRYRPGPRGQLVAEPVPAFLGHVGTIYQGKRMLRVADGAPQTMRLLPDGTTLSNRAISKLRNHERGWRYAADQVARYAVRYLGMAAAEVHIEDGATAAEVRAWAARWIPRVTRPLRHRGNLCYVAGLDGRTRDHLTRRYGSGRPYPKLINGQFIDPVREERIAA